MKKLIFLALILASFQASAEIIQYQQSGKVFYLKSAVYIANSKATVYHNKLLESAINDCSQKTGLVSSILKTKISGLSKKELLSVASQTLTGESLAEFSRKVEIIYNNDNSIFSDNAHTFKTCLKEFHNFD